MDNDGRVGDIGVLNEEGAVATTGATTTSNRTGLDGEAEDDAIGHATGKTQTIIQYDSSDDENNDNMALPENETAGNALNALIGDGNDNYTK
mmetsp:Transcript_72521/g.65216  ORF Transcript_72521/g.65216 Transcript_72521/m.65216 type:complete len:92 (-) Transcript_72521:228-503(-)